MHASDEHHGERYPHKEQSVGETLREQEAAAQQHGACAPYHCRGAHPLAGLHYRHYVGYEEHHGEFQYLRWLQRDPQDGGASPGAVDDVALEQHVESQDHGNDAESYRTPVEPDVFQPGDAYGDRHSDK